MFILLWLVSRWDSTAEHWIVVAVLAGLLVVLSILAAVLWPRSKRWAAQSRLHRLAVRNEANLRGDARGLLDDALRVLGEARRHCLATSQNDDAGQLASLVHQLEAVRDQVACDYTPSPPNARGRSLEPGLDRLLASEAVGRCCEALAERVRGGVGITPEQVDEARQAIAEVTGRGRLPVAS